MAKRRMFSLDVVDTDAFLEMPSSTQSLYFHLGMRADDDGFVSSPKRITSTVNASTDDLKLLATKGFIIPFDSGVCVIKDWKVHNSIQKDRYKPTLYLKEKNLIQTTSCGSYELLDTLCIQDVSSLYTQDRIGKDRIDIDTADKPQKRKRFVPPTLEEVRAYCRERGNKVDAQRFIDHYEANGWVQGKGKPIKDWRAAVRTWESNNKGSPAPKAQIIDAGYSSSDLVEYPEGSGKYIRRDAVPGGMDNAV